MKKRQFYLLSFLLLNSHAIFAESYYWSDNGSHFLKCFKRISNNIFQTIQVDEAFCKNIKKPTLHDWSVDEQNYLRCFEFLDNNSIGVVPNRIKMNGGKSISDDECMHIPKPIKYKWMIETGIIPIKKCYEIFELQVRPKLLNGGLPVDNSKCEAPTDHKSVNQVPRSIKKVPSETEPKSSSDKMSVSR